MKIIQKTVLVSIALAATSALTATSATAGSHCVRAGASATAITNEVATLLAKEALYTQNALAGRKGKGAIGTSCKYQGVVTTCWARQTACK
ncbi:MAG: hypothetical protein NW216_13300 [Hyphomicrobium sp.]|nr:hypothetical protein [Hyphomicrobium sp.]